MVEAFAQFPQYGQANCTTATAPAPLQNQWQHTQYEGHRSHDDRAQTKAYGFKRRIKQIFAAIYADFSKLHNKDRVFCRQADQCDQTDLCINVVGKGGNPH